MRRLIVAVLLPLLLSVTAQAHYKEAFAVVMMHEGECTDHPQDPGGLTCYGISQRSYPELNIAELTVDDASSILYEDFWNKHGYHRLTHRHVAAKMLDLSVPAKRTSCCSVHCTLWDGETFGLTASLARRP